jgi:alpha-glucosidase
VHRLMRRVLDSYPERMTVGEVWVHTDEQLAKYVRPDELNLAFNFRLLQADWDAKEFRSAVEDSLATMGSVGAPTTWALSNHDVVRHASRYARGADDATGRRRARAAGLLQLALPGVVYLYYGDELALQNVELPDEVLQDPVWERSGHTERGRDGERVPMPWSGSEPPYGFSAAAATWLPMPADWAGVTVEAQLEDPSSTLSLYRQALELRREHPGFAQAGLEWFSAPDGCLAFRRPGGLLCALNASTEPVPMPPGELLLASGPIPDAAQLPPDTTVWLV